LNFNLPQAQAPDCLITYLAIHYYFFFFYRFFGISPLQRTNSITIYLSKLAVLLHKSWFLSSKDSISVPFPLIPLYNLAYSGGHPEIYRPYGQNIHHYDINSAYAYAMSLPMPGQLKKIYVFPPFLTALKKKKPIFNPFSDPFDIPVRHPWEDIFGLIYAQVTAPVELKYPILTTKLSSEGKVNPSGTFSGLFFSEELKTAKQLGYSIRPYFAFHFSPCSPFSSLVKFFTDLRLQSPHIFSDGYHPLFLRLATSPLFKVIFKSLINSLYGLLLKYRDGSLPITERHLIPSKYIDLIPYHSILHWYDDDHAQPLWTRQPSLGHSLLDNFPIPNKLPYYLPLYLKYNFNIAQGLAITSYIRCLLAPLKVKYGPYYSDTDSLFLPKPLPKKLVNPHVLGSFKLEWVASQIIFFGPYRYGYILSSQPSIVHTISDIQSFNPQHITCPLDPNYLPPTDDPSFPQPIPSDTWNRQLLVSKGKGLYSNTIPFDASTLDILSPSFPFANSDLPSTPTLHPLAILLQDAPSPSHIPLTFSRFQDFDIIRTGPSTPRRSSDTSSSNLSLPLIKTQVGAPSLPTQSSSSLPNSSLPNSYSVIARRLDNPDTSDQNYTDPLNHDDDSDTLQQDQDDNDDS
jgi:hypothetical protein